MFTYPLKFIINLHYLPLSKLFVTIATRKNIYLSWIFHESIILVTVQTFFYNCYNKKISYMIFFMVEVLKSWCDNCNKKIFFFIVWIVSWISLYSFKLLQEIQIISSYWEEKWQMFNVKNLGQKWPNIRWPLLIARELKSSV